MFYIRRSPQDSQSFLQPQTQKYMVCIPRCNKIRVGEDTFGLEVSFALCSRFFELIAEYVAKMLGGCESNDVSHYLRPRLVLSRFLDQRTNVRIFCA
jgi:hypothetical protein